MVCGEASAHHVTGMTLSNLLIFLLLPLRAGDEGGALESVQTVPLDTINVRLLAWVTVAPNLVHVFCI